MIRLLAEAAASARSQPVASALTILMVAGMVLTVMMTTGRSVAAEQQVLSSIDDAGTRSIQIRAEDDAGLRSDVLSRIGRIDGVEWSAAFSSAEDATNALIPGGTPVPVRYVTSDNLDRLGIEQVPVPGNTAYASMAALDLFGLIETGGAISLPTGETVPLGGRIEVPDYLSGLEPLSLIPTPAGPDRPVGIVIVIVERPEQITAVAAAVTSVIAVDDPSRVTVQTSEQLAQLRGVIQSQLADSSRILVLALLGITTLLVAVILYGLVVLRRKDFGRRRALGATRGFIIALLISQTLLLGATGTVVGLGAATTAAAVLGDPLPGFEFTTAISILAITAALLAALAPAISASRREPIRELRVP